MDPVVAQMQSEDQQTIDPNNTPAKIDPVVAQMQQEDAAQLGRAALAVGTNESNVDEATNNKLMAQKFNTTPEVVAKFPDEFKQRMKIELANQALSQAPKLQQTIADNPRIADVMHPDVPAAAELEKTLTQSWMDTPGALIKRLGGGTNELGGTLGLLASAFPVFEDKLTSLLTQKDTTDFQDAWYKNVVQPIMDRNPDFALDKNARLPEKIAGAGGDLLSMISQTVTGGTEVKAATMAETTAAALEHSLKAMVAPSAEQAVQTYKDMYQETGDHLRSANAALVKFFTSSAAAATPLGAKGDVGLATRLGGNFISGVSSNELSRQVMNMVTPNSMHQKADAESDLISGLMMSGMGELGPHNGDQQMYNDFVRKTYDDANAREKSQREADMLHTVSDLASNIAWRENDPASFKQWVDKVTDNGISHVYVDGEVFNQAMKKNNVTPEQLQELAPDVASQIKEATETQPGGMVKIPMSDYLAHMAGTSFGKELEPNIKIDPEGRTKSELDAEESKQEEAWQAVAKDMLEKRAGDKEFQASADKVYNESRQMHEATGIYHPEVAKQYAIADREAYAVLAHKLGITPEEAFKRWGFKLTSDRIAANAESVYHQAGGNDHGSTEDNGRTGEQGRTVPLDLRTVGGDAPAEGWAKDTRIAVRSGSGSEPQVVYRATHPDRPLAPEHFDYENLGKASDKMAAKLGIFSTSSKEDAATHGDLVEPFYLDMQNPAYVHFDDLPGFDDPQSYWDYARQLEEQGHDGIVLHGKALEPGQVDHNLPYTHYVAFHPEQMIHAHEATDNHALTYEVAPHPTDDPQIKARWDALSTEAKSEITQRVTNSVVKMAIKDMFPNLAGKYVVRTNIGGYHDDTNHSLSLTFGKDADPAEIAELAKALGYTLHQDSMMVTSTKPFPGSFEMGRVTIDNISASDAKSVYDSIRTLKGDDGKPLISGHTTSDGAMSILVDKGTEKEIAARIDKHLGDRTIGYDRTNVAWPEKGEDNYGYKTTETRGVREEVSEPSLLENLDHFRRAAEGQRDRLIGEAERAASVFGQPGRAESSGAGAGSGGGHGSGQTLGLGQLREVSGRLAKETFSQKLAEAKAELDKLGLGKYVFQKTADELEGMRTFMTPDGLGGVAVKPDGEITALFKHPDSTQKNFAATALELGRQAGGTRLAAFGDGLGRIYSRNGFEQILRAPAQGDMEQAGYYVYNGKPHEYDPNAGELMPDYAAARSNPAWIAAEANPLRQDKRGWYDPRTRTIGVGKDSDLSTVIHEKFHHYFDIYTHLAKEADAPQIVKDDVDVLLKHVGVKGDTAEERLANWHDMSMNEQRDMHEQIAEMGERYMATGKAPSIALQPVFARFRQWLMRVYGSEKNTGQEYSPEVKKVFDSWFATEEQIKDAEAARNFTSLFSEKPEGISDADWEEYKQQGQDATNEGVDQLQERSLRDMKWGSNAKNKYIRQAQMAAARERRAIRDQVTKEVANTPIEKVRKWLKTGEMTTPEGEEIKAVGGFKLNLDDVKRLYPDLSAEEIQKLRGMVAKDGLHPDLVAEFPGIEMGSGRALIKQLLEAPDAKTEIDGITDQRMLEQHGDLNSPEAIADAADRAIHNDLRAKFMATGLKMLVKSPVPSKVLLNGAREAAEAAIAEKKVGDINPKQYEAAEAKSTKEALKAAPKDVKAAVQAQRAAILNNQLAASSRKAQDDVRKIVSYLKRFNKDSVLKKMDVDIREQVTDLLNRFDLRQNPTTGPTKEQTSLAMWIESQKAAGFSPSVSPDIANPAFRTHYKDMTVGQFRSLLDTVKMLEHIGKERKMVTIDGQRVSVREAADSMIAKMKERGEKFTDAQLVEPARLGVDPLWRVALDRMRSALSAGHAEFLANHFKANMMDMHEIMGPFHRNFFEPVIAANYKYLDLARDVANKFREGAKELGLDWQKSMHDVVENHNLMDNSLTVPAKRRLTKSDLIGIAMHVGNESNFEKLTGGMKWDPKDVWQALHDNMTDKDWDAVERMWDVAGSHWPEMVEMDKRLGNTSPDKIEPRAFKVKRADGTEREIKGGYAPVRYDPLRSKLGKRKADASNINPGEGLFDKGYFRSDTTTNGSLNARSNYHDFVDLDFHAMEQSINDTVRDLAYREALINAHKLYADNEFSKQFLRTYGPEQYKALGKWLGNLVNADVQDSKSSMITKMMSSTRRAMVANGIAFRISTMFKHGGSAGAKTVGYLAGGGEKYFASRVRAMAFDHGKQVVEGLAKSPELRARAQQQDRDLSERVASMMEPESLHSKAERFGHAGVAYMDFFTAVPTFHAAYDWATTEGIPERLGGTGKPMSEADAIKWADSIVREAHGTNIEAGRSNLINNKDEAVKMLTTLHGFMNNSFGQLCDMIDKKRYAKDFGTPELLARFTMSQIVPALMAGYITMGPKVDNEPWWEWAAKCIGGELAGSVAGIRDAYSMIVEGHDSAGEPPYMKVAKDAHQLAIKDTAKGASDKHVLKDAGNVGGLFLPGLGQAGATSQFIYDEAKGKQHAHTVGEWLRGIMTGKADPNQK